MIDGKGVALVIYFQGCSLHCKGCHNPKLWDFKGGKEVSCDEIIDYWNKNRDLFDSIVFQGGEPTDQFEALKYISTNIDGEKWLYTGKEREELPEEVFTLFDVVIYGRFSASCYTGGFPATTNQTIYTKGDKNDC
jgi:anaerobic ribonucleoside-triphosphate reductase activating protein